MSYGLCFFPMVSVGGEVEDIGEALQRVVDFVGKVIGHGSLGGGFGAFHKLLLLAHLAHTDGGEVSEDFHDVAVALIEGFFAGVGQDIDGPAHFIGLPGKHEAVGYGFSGHAELVEVALVGADALGTSTLEANAASAGMMRKDGVEQVGILAGDGDPMVIGIFGAVLFFEADGRAVGSAELNGGLHQHLQDSLRILNEGVSDAAHPLGDYCDAARARVPGSKGKVGLDVDNFQPCIT